LFKKGGDEMPGKSETKLPTSKEIDAMAVFPSNEHQCAALCHDLLNAVEQLQGATGIKRIRLLARIRALRGRMQELKCRLCLPE
jgi:hypothetical protein